MRKIIIVGATSGIGRELARLYAGAGDLVGVTGRRQDLLYSLQLEYPNRIVTESYDATAPGAAAHLASLVRKLDGLDLLIFNAGWGELTESLDWEVDRATVDINVNAFLTTIHFGWRHFIAQGHGHLVTVSSIASIRGNRHSPAYSAAKSFQSTYFEGLYIKTRRMHLPIHLTDIQPGFVNTQLAKGPRFWVAPVGKAARQIVRAIEKKRWRVYITHRWRLIAVIFKYIPGWLYHRFG